jgi:hypothetical protein
MPSLIDGRGRPVRLAAELARGGEAVVYEVQGRAELLAKIHLPGKAPDAGKLAAMLAMTDVALRNQCAWPVDMLHDGGQFAGFLMPRIANHRPLFELYLPKLRLAEFPRADWRFLLRAAENTARVFHDLHQAGVVIGDVNHSNLLVAPDATVRCIDCDSFQITAGAQRWLCRVGTGDYQPPELQGRTSYDGVVRTLNHDNFGLAVLIFQLLFAGRHPFSGRWLGVGDAPSIEEAIRSFRFAYARHRMVGLRPPANALPLRALPDKIRELFELAFDRAATKGGRPTAEHWATALQALSRNVRQCRRQRLHWFYSGASTCPWCELEQQSGAVLFGPPRVHQPAIPRTPSGQPQPPAWFAWARAHRKGLLVTLGIVLWIWFVSDPQHPVTHPAVTPAPAAAVAAPRLPPPRSETSTVSPPAPPQQPSLPAPTPLPQVPGPAPAPPTAAAAAMPMPQPEPVVQAPMPIDPSYDCAKAQAPLQTFICSDAALSRADLEMAQPYYVLRQLVGRDGWRELLYEAVGFQNQTAYDCRITDAGELPPDQAVLKTCLLAAYRAQRQVWLRRLWGAGSEEASRPVEQHIALQARLQELGYLRATAKIDGVYGAATRAAIIAWQTAVQLPVTGLLGDGDAFRLQAAAARRS